MEIIDRDNGYVLLRVGPEREMYDAREAGGRLLEEAARAGAVMVYCDYWLRTSDGGGRTIRSMTVSRAVCGRTSTSGR